MLSAPALEVCAGPAHADAVHVSLGAREVEDGYVLAGGVRLVVDEMPAGTFGFGDLALGAEVIKVGSSPEVRVAGLLDVVRIAEARGALAPRREALAYQAGLDVERERGDTSRRDDRTAEETIEAWVMRQTPVRRAIDATLPLSLGVTRLARGAWPFRLHAFAVASADVLFGVRVAGQFLAFAEPAAVETVRRGCLGSLAVAESSEV